MASVGLAGWAKIAILIAAVTPSIYIPRFFCRFLCPMGALLEPLSKFKVTNNVSLIHVLQFKQLFSSFDNELFANV
jgi:hypothetical protein